MCRSERAAEGKVKAATLQSLICKYDVLHLQTRAVFSYYSTLTHAPPAAKKCYTPVYIYLFLFIQLANGSLFFNRRKEADTFEPFTSTLREIQRVQAYLRVRETGHVRVEVELDPRPRSWQRHSSDQQDQQHGVRKGSCHIHNLQV